MFSFFWWRQSERQGIKYFGRMWWIFISTRFHSLGPLSWATHVSPMRQWSRIRFKSWAVWGYCVVCLPCCLDNSWEPVNLLLYIVYKTDCVKQLGHLLENFIFRATTCERNFICCECEQNRKPGVDVSVRLRCMEAVKQCTAADAGNSSQAAHWSQVGHILLLFSGYIWLHAHMALHCVSKNGPTLNGIARNDMDWFWWYLAEIFRRL